MRVLRKILPILLILIFVLSLPCQVFGLGREIYYLNVSIDDSAYRFIASTMFSDAYLEKNTPEKMSTDVELENEIEAMFFDDGNPDFDNMPLSFPCKGKAKPQDKEAIAKIQTNLIPSLNDAIYFIKGTTFADYRDFANFCHDLFEILPNGGDINGCKVTKGKNASADREVLGTDGEPLGDDYYITVKNSKGTSRSFLFACEKNSSCDSDIETVDWRIIMQEAFAHYAAGYTSQTATEIEEPSIAIKLVVELGNAFVNGISHFFGLHNVDELIFNGGMRATDTYLSGAIKKSWIPTINALYMVFFIVSLLTILFSIGKMVLRKNVANITGDNHESVVVGVKNLVVAGILLILMYPLFALFLKFSFSITDIFANFADPLTRGEFFSKIAIAQNSIASVFASFVWLIMSIYLNIYYAMREILLAVLLASSPLFVMFYTFGEDRQKAFTIWIKVFLATIFIQPIHAFVLGLLMAIPLGEMTTLEGFVYLGALVPVTEQMRKLIFQEFDSVGSAARTAAFSVGTAGAAVGKTAYMAKKTAPVVSSATGKVAGATIKAAGHAARGFGENGVKGAASAVYGAGRGVVDSVVNNVKEKASSTFYSAYDTEKTVNTSAMGTDTSTNSGPGYTPGSGFSSPQADNSSSIHTGSETTNTVREGMKKSAETTNTAKHKLY